MALGFKGLMRGYGILRWISGDFSVSTLKRVHRSPVVVGTSSFFMNVSCLSLISWYQSNNESRVVSAFSRHVHVNKADYFLKSERMKWFRVLKALIGAGKSMKGCLWLPDCGFYCKNGFIFSRFPALYPAAVKCEFCCHLFSLSWDVGRLSHPRQNTVYTHCLLNRWKLI